MRSMDIRNDGSFIREVLGKDGFSYSLVSESLDRAKQYTMSGGKITIKRIENGLEHQYMETSPTVLFAGKKSGKGDAAKITYVVDSLIGGQITTQNHETPIEKYDIPIKLKKMICTLPGGSHVSMHLYGDGNRTWYNAHVSLEGESGAEIPFVNLIFHENMNEVCVEYRQSNPDGLGSLFDDPNATLKQPFENLSDKVTLFGPVGKLKSAKKLEKYANEQLTSRFPFEEYFLDMGACDGKLDSHVTVFVKDDDGKLCRLTDIILGDNDEFYLAGRLPDDAIHTKPIE